MNWELVATFGVLVALIVTLLRTLIAPDMVLLGGLAILLVLGVVSPAEGLSGFSNEGVATIAARAMSQRLGDLMRSARAISRGIGHGESTVENADGLTGVVGSLNKMAQELQASVTQSAGERARFQAVLEGMAEAVIALDDQRSVTHMNPAAHALLGTQKSQEGTPLLELLPVPVLQQLLSQQQMQARATVEFTLPSNGRVVQATQTGQRGGGRVLVLHDVTELRRLETIRRDFVANVSHELRTPVSIVGANLETLLDGALSDEVYGPKLTKAALKNAERLKNIINDLLDLSRLEAGQYDVDASGLAIDELIQRAVESFPREISVHVNDTDLKVVGDSQAIDQVLLNLLDNAVKYTPQDATIKVTAEAIENRVRVAVRDTGPGIEPRLRGRVFERFYRVDPGRSREMGGTGLGLAIVKHLVENMGGTVGLEANSPRGSVFWFELNRHAEGPAQPSAKVL